MPARIRLELFGPAPSSPFRHADGMRALALAAIRRSLPDLATFIHEANQPNPLTIGPLLTSAKDRGKHTIEIACLADEVLQPLLKGLPRAGGRIKLGRMTYDVRQVSVGAEVSFDDLAAHPEGRTIGLRLLTPTAHHAPGAVRRSLVVPDPALYVGSWYRRWNLYAPSPFSEALMESVAQQVVIRAFAGGTSAVRLDRVRTFIGFTGRVEFTVLDGPADTGELCAALWSLARFAEYCGTGVDTMRGMGQTRLIPLSDTAPQEEQVPDESSLHSQVP